MNLELESFLDQKERWPQAGRHIMAQYDDESIVVYQAYEPSIGHFAAREGHFGGDFSYSRMSWIKPNFLWMMYRSGWGQKEGQEVTLAIRLRRAFFEEILAGAVWSSYRPGLYEHRPQWQSRLKSSEVRLQWDPDHGPTGEKLERRAIQLGLRGDCLKRFGNKEVLEIQDISEFVAEQRSAASKTDFQGLITPREEIFVPKLPEASSNVGLSLED